MSQSMGAGVAPSASALAPPHGLDGVIVTFGDIFDYIREDHTLDPRWQTEQLTTIPLPFPIALSWDSSRQVQRISCHRLLAQTCTNVFSQIHSAGLQSKITSSADASHSVRSEPGPNFRPTPGASRSI